MVAIQIRDVPEELRDTLAAAAQERDLSLQLFLMEVLEREGRRARNVAAVREWSRDPLATEASGIDAAELIRHGRQERTAHLLEAVGAPEAVQTERGSAE